MGHAENLFALGQHRGHEGVGGGQHLPHGGDGHGPEAGDVTRLALQRIAAEGGLDVETEDDLGLRSLRPLRAGGCVTPAGGGQLEQGVGPVGLDRLAPAL